MTFHCWALQIPPTTSSRKWDTALELWNMSKRLGEILLNTASWHLLLSALTGKRLPWLTRIFVTPTWALLACFADDGRREETQGLYGLEPLVNEERRSVRSSDPLHQLVCLCFGAWRNWNWRDKRFGNGGLCTKNIRHAAGNSKFNFQCFTFWRGLVFDGSWRSNLPCENIPRFHVVPRSSGVMAKHIWSEDDMTCGAGCKFIHLLFRASIMQSLYVQLILMWFSGLLLLLLFCMSKHTYWIWFVDFLCVSSFGMQFSSIGVTTFYL